MDKILAKLKEYGPAVRKEISLTTTEKMKKIFERSQQLVPVLTGELKASGEVFQTEKGAGIRYNTPYASRVEFDLTLRHDQGQAFFVGQPFQETKQQETKNELRKAAVRPLKK